VIKELKIAKNIRFITELITFQDDNFLQLSTKEIKEFSEKYKKEINVPFSLVGIHPLAVDREKIRYLVDAGLFLTRMGIQSASSNTKKFYKRNYPNSVILKACQIINEFKDKIKISHYDIILDNPWEKEEDLIETLMFLSRLPVPYDLVLFFLTFFPGTEIYDLAEKDGLTKNKIDSIYRKNYWKLSFESMSYINRIFILLRDTVIFGEKISPRLMFILTNKVFRKTGLSSILYYSLFLRVYIIKLYKKRLLDF
jgi:radical SAM superfamily enzyme